MFTDVAYNQISAWLIKKDCFNTILSVRERDNGPYWTDPLVKCSVKVLVDKPI
jgi:hypothetical protein